MNPSREKAMLALALERPADERAPFLDRVCAGDPALRERVEDLLVTHGRPPEPGASGGGTRSTAPLLEEVELTEGPGSVVGRYGLLERLGEGGFGVVWASEQREPVRRRVALKIIKLGMDTRQVVARFEAERQALALMDHPNIARVLDAGATQTGRPYFVMELVQGIPITAYCGQEKISTRERLDLFIKVCHAVQHAHQKGIVHRDIKPSNIMVALHDGVPVPKVIDFGIAKATQVELTERTIFTRYGQFFGTPAYMSPEQAGMSGFDIDTRSDIYSLGVLLYELLTGTTPFETTELVESGLDEMRRIIREREPVRPSTRIRQTTSVASSGVAPSASYTALAGDLDWIVMKCLEKDRTRRYETANALAMDLRRHLNDEPVSARPPSVVYRFRKAWRRHRVVWAAGAIVIIALIAGIVGTSIGLFRAAEEQARAQNALETARGAARDAQEARGLAESNAAMLETSLYFSRIALAHRESLSRPANIKQAEKLLDQCPSALRNWEWHYLKRRRFFEPVVIGDPAGRIVQSVTFSPDNRHLATGGSDGKVRIWELAGHRPIQTLAGHAGFVVSVAFSPTNPGWIASAGSDDRLRLWDWRAAREMHAWSSATSRDFGMAYAVAFSPDGERLAAPGENGAVRVRFIAEGHDTLTLAGHDDGAYCVAFSPDGRWIATGAGDGVVRVWDGSSGRARTTLGSKTTPVSCVAFAGDSRRLVALQFDGSVRLWDVSLGGQLSSYSVRTAGSPLVGLAVHPGGQRAFTGGLDRLVSVSEPATARSVLVFRELANSCYCLALSPDGQRLAAGGRDGSVYVLDATPLDGTEDPALRTFDYPGGEVWAVDVSPTRSSIAVGGYGPPSSGPGTPVFILHGPDDPPTRLPGHEITVFGLAHDRTGRFLASCGDGPAGEARVKVWDLESGREAFPVESFEGERRLFAVVFSPDGRWLVAAGNDRKIKVWEAATGRKVGVVGGHANEITALAFSSRGTYLASVGNDDTVKVWDGRNLDAPQSSPRVFPALAGGLTDLLAFSPDESRLAVVLDDDTAIIHDLADGARAVRLSSPDHRPLALAFSPDGRWVASGGVDCTVRLWEASSAVLRHTLRSHRDVVARLRFARFPAGTRLISGSRDGTVKLWDMIAIERRLSSP